MRANGCPIAVYEHGGDLFRLARFQQTFLLAALDQTLDFFEIIDPQRLHRAVIGKRQQRARTRVGEQLARGAGRCAQVHRRNSAKECAARGFESRSAAR